ncbi:HYD1 signature containing ADP-ribosyltransferase family protein [Neobacillus mesonae]|uniref:HYD1 signature containing ADP-ribosyltransferase family protein n=1 Tax=Neobacillus mesonae TaxID=1193713 RepID=UPI00399CBF4C
MPYFLYIFLGKANGILDSNQLNPSLKANNPKDVRFGNGQYLSDITLETKTPAQLAKSMIMIPSYITWAGVITIQRLEGLS